MRRANEDWSVLADLVPRLPPASFIDDCDLAQSLVRQDVKTARAYDWPLVAQAYHREVYTPLLNAVTSRTRDTRFAVPVRNMGDWQWPR